MNVEYQDFISKATANLSSERAKFLLEEISKKDVEDLNSMNIIFALIENDMALPNVVKQLIFSLIVLIILNFLVQIFSVPKNNSVIKYTACVVLSLTIILPIYDIISASIEYMGDISSFLGILYPLTGIITATGGNIAAAKAQGIFFSILLSSGQFLLNKLLPVVVSIFIGMAVIDTFWGERKMVAISQFIRNSFFGIFAIATAIFFIIVNFYNKAAAGNDTISAKTLKLLVSNAIPIIGSTVGEALKLLGGGIVTAKNSIGLTAIIFILALFVPLLVLLWGYGLILNFYTLLCDYFEVYELKGIVFHLKCAIDYTLATFSVITILAFINIGHFMSTIPSVISS